MKNSQLVHTLRRSFPRPGPVSTSPLKIGLSMVLATLVGMPGEAQTPNAPESRPAANPEANGGQAQGKKRQRRARPNPGQADAAAPAGARESAPGPERSRGVAPYTEALRFDPSDNGLSIDNPQIKWEHDEESNTFNVNGLKLEASALQLAITQMQRKDAVKRFDLKDRPAILTTISLQWPEILTRTGTLSFEKPTGEVIYSRAISEEDKRIWARLRSETNPEMQKNHDKAAWGSFDIAREPFGFLWDGATFRACMSQKGEEESQVKICTPVYQTRSDGLNIDFSAVSASNPPTVVYNEKSVGPNGILNFKIGTAIKLRFDFGQGAFVEVTSLPADMKLVDAVQSSNGREILLTGHGAKPIGKSRVISEPITHFWAPTGISQERVWQMAIDRDAPTLRLLGPFNVPFTMLFAYDRLPRERDRVFIRSTRSSGTYSSSPTVLGYTPSSFRISSDQQSAYNSSPTHFEWKFAAPEKGQDNRARLKLHSRDGVNTWIANHNMYRTYPFEVSGRLTGIATLSGELLLLGEISGAVWLESLGLTQNYYLSKQRWGIAAKYFRSLTDLQTTSGKSISDFSVLNMDLKYHLLPGLWHYDELVGLIGGMQTVELAGLSPTLLGVGAYWARTMPKIFDDIFNLFPFMSYRKYVDMEFIYYPVTFTTGYEAGQSFALNFHGKVFWTNRFFGEAGFGMRTYDFALPSKRATVNLNMFYGTAGLGLIF
jgi:hypothetical protein